VNRVGEDETVRLLSVSLGPIGEDGTTARSAGRDGTPRPPRPRFGG